MIIPELLKYVILEAGSSNENEQRVLDNDLSVDIVLKICIKDPV